MRPKRNLSLTPGKHNVRMMSLFFGDLAHSIHKIQRLLEVREKEFAMKEMFVRDRPVGKTLLKIFQFLPLEGSNAPAAGNTFLVGKLFDHDCLPRFGIVNAIVFYWIGSSYQFDSLNRRDIAPKAISSQVSVYNVILPSYSRD